jgi:hypothetical protein
MADQTTDLVEVVVKFAPAAASPDAATHCALLERLARTGISLELMHPGSSDPELATFALARVHPNAVARVLEQLRNSEGV